MGQRENEYQRAYRKDHLDKLRAAQRARYHAHTEEVKRRTAAYREANPDLVQRARRAYYEAHRGEILQKQKDYRETHREQKAARDAAYKREYSREHRDELRQKNNAYRAANPAKVKAWAKRERQKRPQQTLARNAARRVRLKRGSVGDMAGVAAFYEKVGTARRIRCYWCKGWVKKEERQVDHIIPVSSGGKHAAGNLCCSCRRCNQSKGSRAPEEFGGQFELRF